MLQQKYFQCFGFTLYLEKYYLVRFIQTRLNFTDLGIPNRKMSDMGNKRKLNKMLMTRSLGFQAKPISI